MGEIAINLHLGTSDDDSAVQHPRVRVRLAAGERLDILDVLRTLEQNPHNSNGRREGAGAVDGTGHQDRLPLGGHAHATRLGVAEGEPVLSLGVSLEDVVQFNVDVAELGVGDDGVVVEDGESDDGAGLVGDQELGGTLPNGVGSALQGLRLMDLLAIESDRDEGVDLLPAGVELLGLVDDEANDSGLCIRKRRSAPEHPAQS